MIKNIIFDLGGVVLDLDLGKVLDSFDNLGFTEAGDMLNKFLPKGIFTRLEDGTADRYEIYRYIRKSTGRDIPSWRIDDALNNFITGLAPYKLRMLEKLRTDYKLYILSNTNEIMIPEIARIWFTQDGKNINDYFDRIFFSFEMKMLKPESEIFEKLAADAGIIPSETLFIDDGQHNIDSAARCGFHTYRPEVAEDLRVSLIRELMLPEGYFTRQQAASFG